MLKFSPRWSNANASPRLRQIAFAAALAACGVLAATVVANAFGGEAQAQRKYGPFVLYNFRVECYPADMVPPTCLNNGTVKFRIVLDGRYANEYNYPHGIPYRLRLYLSAGTGFSGKIHYERQPGDPPVSKTDKHWYWVKVNGRRLPQWLWHHLYTGIVPGWLGTASQKGSPSQLCIKVVATPLVKRPRPQWPPTQTSKVCFTPPAGTTTTSP